MQAEIPFPRDFLLTIQQGFGQTQIILSIFDTLITLFIYWRVGGPAVKLLLVCSILKCTNLLWLCLGIDYHPSYSDELCALITIGLEVGWFFNDHIASLSTLQKLLYIPQPKPRKITAIALMSISASLGLCLRINRSSCRFGHCISIDSSHLAPMTDAAIASNVIITEMILVGMMSIFFYEMYRVAASRSSVVSELFKQGLLRLFVLLPFGILEVAAYAAQKKLPNSINVLLEIGIYARHMYPSLLAIAISMTRVKLEHSTEVKQTQRKEQYP